MWDETSKVDYTVDMEFVNKVLDFKHKVLKGRKPTRFEIQQLLKREPETIEEEIDQMFKEYSDVERL
jgi:hypothetical protein